MINIYISNNKAFVWNADDAFKLRRDHRIVGSFVGLFPQRQNPNVREYLPFQLSNVEATLLAEKGIAQLVVNTEVIEKPTAEHKEKFFKQRNEDCDRQIQEAKEKKKSTLLENIELIYKGRKRICDENSSLESKRQKTSKIHTDEDLGQKMKQQDTSEIQTEEGSDQEAKKQDTSETQLKDSDQKEKQQEIMEIQKDKECEEDIEMIDESAKEEIIEKEMVRWSNTMLSYNNCSVQCFREFPFKDTTKNVPFDWKFPQTDEEKLKYAVFKDLWEKNYYLTSGTKFGGDYLVYTGDPVLFHSVYIVICLPINQEIRADDVVVFGRMGTQVKKTTVLASINVQNEVQYISLSWAPRIGGHKKRKLKEK